MSGFFLLPHIEIKIGNPKTFSSYNHKLINGFGALLLMLIILKSVFSKKKKILNVFLKKIKFKSVFDNGFMKCF